MALSHNNVGAEVIDYLLERSRESLKLTATGWPEIGKWAEKNEEGWRWSKHYNDVFGRELEMELRGVVSNVDFGYTIRNRLPSKDMTLNSSSGNSDNSSDFKINLKLDLPTTVVTTKSNTNGIQDSDKSESEPQFKLALL